MRLEALYIIRPTEALGEHLKQTDSEVAQFLSVPRLWTKKEGGRTAWTDEDNEAQSSCCFSCNFGLSTLLALAQIKA